MKVWYVTRWVANEAKLRGHTIRRSPSEISYEIILEDGRWFRLPRDPLKEPETFAVAIEVEKDELNRFLRKLEQEEYIAVNPGEFGNPLKGAYVFYQLEWKGESDVIDDSGVIQLRVKRKKLVFVPRPSVEGSWRVYQGSPPGSARFAREEAVKALTEEKEFRPGVDPKVRWVQEGDTWRLENIPIAIEGVWNGVKVDKDLMLRLIENFERLKATLYVPLKIGHTSKFVENAKYEKTGEPALGYVKELWWDEETRTLRATFTKVPKLLVDLIKKGAFTGVSIEIDPDFSGLGDTLVGVAILGAEIPAMTSLPRLISIYAKEGSRYSLEFPKLIGGGTVEQKETALDILLAQNPHAILLFQAGGEGDMEALVKVLHDKGYPKVLAEELLELMPNPTEEKVKLLPDYDKTLWEPRLETLEKRAQIPEKCEKVIAELEEFLEMHKEELDDDTKAKVEAILAEAKKNLPHVEVTETEAEAKAEVKEEKEESYPSATQEPSKAEEHKEEAPAPTKAEKYPEEGVNVVLEELQRLKQREEELQLFQQQLAQRAMEAINSKIMYFQAVGVPAEVLPDLRQALIELDPTLTKEPDRSFLQNLILKLVSLRPPTQTFQRLLPPEVDSGEGDLAKLILQHTKKAKRDAS